MHNTFHATGDLPCRPLQGLPLSIILAHNEHHVSPALVMLPGAPLQDLPLSIILTHNAALPQSFSLRFYLNSTLILSGPVDDSNVAISPSVTLDFAQLPGPFRMGPGRSRS
jgi:hypothetical protein